MIRKKVIKKLADLMDTYNATMGYTRDDDGIHIYMDSDSMFRGWITWLYIGG